LCDGLGLIARRFERLVQQVGTVGEGDGFHNQPRIVRGMAKLLNHDEPMARIWMKGIKTSVSPP
jgi:hypothetical protein